MDYKNMARTLQTALQELGLNPLGMQRSLEVVARLHGANWNQLSATPGLPLLPSEQRPAALQAALTHYRVQVNEAQARAFLDVLLPPIVIVDLKQDYRSLADFLAEKEKAGEADHPRESVNDHRLNEGPQNSLWHFSFLNKPFWEKFMVGRVITWLRELPLSERESEGSTADVDAEAVTLFSELREQIPALEQVTDLELYDLWSEFSESAFHAGFIASDQGKQHLFHAWLLAHGDGTMKQKSWYGLADHQQNFYRACALDLRRERGSGEEPKSFPEVQLLWTEDGPINVFLTHQMYQGMRSQPVHVMSVQQDVPKTLMGETLATAQPVQALPAPVLNHSPLSLVVGRNRFEVGDEVIKLDSRNEFVAALTIAEVQEKFVITNDGRRWTHGGCWRVSAREHYPYPFIVPVAEGIGERRSGAKWQPVNPEQPDPRYERHLNR